MPARKSKKYAENPFLPALIKESETTTKRITSTVNDNNDLVIVNRSDGSIQANAAAAIRIRHTVERNEFVKLYTRGVGAMFGLNRAGQRVFSMLFDQLAGRGGVQKDKVTLYYPTLDDETKNDMSYRTFTNGINNLISQGFIAETLVPHQYYINPCYLFNGDRLAVINLYKVKEGEGGGFDGDTGTDTGGASS